MVSSLEKEKAERAIRKAARLIWNEEYKVGRKLSLGERIKLLQTRTTWPDDTIATVVDMFRVAQV